MLYIDDIPYPSGASLPAFSEGTGHDMKLISDDLNEWEVFFYHADMLPVVSVTARDNDIESILADPIHRNYISADITIMNPKTQESVHDVCEFSGHGDSTWETEKKSFEFKMLRSYSLLGLNSYEKWTLIGNGMDNSNLKNRVVYEASTYMDIEYPTECEYINFYINGIYQGLYLLAGRPSSNGGMINLKGDLDEENQVMNLLRLPNAIINNEGTVYEEKYYDLNNTPQNISGSYLMEFVQFGIPQGKQEEKSWFMTDNMMVKLKSPKVATEKELYYIRDYTQAAERAIFSPDGKDPESKIDVHECIDFNSWATVYLFMDFFGYQDTSAGSLFFYKYRNDPVLYCGPIWDYDKSMTDNYYDEEPFPWYGRSDFYVVYDAINQYELWHSGLNHFQDFHSRVMANYRAELEPAMNYIIKKKIPEWLEQTETSFCMDEIRWSRRKGSEAERAKAVADWLNLRKELFDKVWIRGESSPYSDNIY